MQLAALVEGIVSDVRHRRGEDDRGDTGALSEGLLPDLGDSGWKGDWRQLRALVEGVSFDAGDRLRDGDGREIPALLEDAVREGRQPSPFEAHRLHAGLGEGVGPDRRDVWIDAS